MKKGMVYFVGAGPGDPGLMTVKGLSCIQKADVIVYDRLASSKLLAQAPRRAELIYVGKSPEKHALVQEKINLLLVEKAKEGKCVVRLKGGDPFLFGRGGEEAECLCEHAILFEVVPGVTSALAVPAYAGIPVTHRNYTSAVCIVTGNEDPMKEDSDLDWSKIATSAGTLVFLMGMANLGAICQRLMENGRAPKMPVALIRWGTRPEQRTLIGTLATIETYARETHFTNPAVIVVGDVVNLREKLAWFERRPLFGKRVLVTRAREQASQMSQAIEYLGGEAVEFPTICVAPPLKEDVAKLDTALAEVSGYQWIVFTSVNGVVAFFDRLAALEMDVRDLKGPRLCAIGPKTADELRGKGLRVDFLPELYRAEAIVEGLKGEIQEGDRILLPRADIARKVLPETLTMLGAQVNEIAAYRTVQADDEGAGERLCQELCEGRIHIVTFTSSSTVTNFLNLVGAESIPSWRSQVRVASIGPITSETAAKRGLTVDIEAEEYTIEGLVKSLCESVQ
ncbi:MAG: uroporphyrinogen-III C-methyltransferase [Peptococcaceae bacterium]|nr:uroporphyrinogen-III C-methyltransferase [Peptococcaceae bacterium]